MLWLVVIASADPLTSSNFESDDGNLAANATANPATYDWNSFAPLTWTGTAPYRTSSGSGVPLGSLNYNFAGLEDGSALDSTKGADDSSFAGGTKEDGDCPTVIAGSSPNKDDLKRVYLASTVDASGNVFLNLAWERIPLNSTTSSAYIDFEFNQAAQTATATQCSQSSFNVTKTGTLPVQLVHRTAGDLLVRYAFSGGQAGVATIAVETWGVTANQTSNPITCDVSSDTPKAGKAGACWSPAVSGITYNAAVDDGGLPTDASGTDTANTPSGLPSGDALAPDGTDSLGFAEFGEAGVNLTPFFAGKPCESFGTADAVSESSGNSSTASMEDLVNPAPFTVSNCARLSVNKYIDTDEDVQNSTSGEPENATDNVATGGIPAATRLSTDLTGWWFKVSGPSGICTGQTGADGALGTCTESDGTTVLNLAKLSPGTYTITEPAVAADTPTNASKTIGNNASPWFNSDPGDGSGHISTGDVSKQVTIGSATPGNVAFGNSCYATAGFSVTGVPTDGSVTSMTVSYKVNGGATAHTKDLSQVGTTSTWSGSVGGLRKGDVISWSFYINGASSHTKAGSDITMSGYPVCGGSQSAAFGQATINGVKYKDVNANGSKDPGEGKLQGFTFQLKDSGGSVKQTVRSDSNGQFSFTSVDPGTYTIHEVAVSGWTQTQPSAGGDVTVNVFLGDTTVSTDSSGNSILFGNTPLSTIKVTFTSQAKLLNADGTASSTDATQATAMSCTDRGGGSVGSGIPLTASDLTLNQSSVACTVTFTDP